MGNKYSLIKDFVYIYTVYSSVSNRTSFNQIEVG